jgi:RNA polymerase sigma-70 factor (ECF subfamily)
VQTWATDAMLVDALRARDESAFEHLLTTWSRSMLRLARSFVSTDASAEEVVQDTWLAVLQGIDGFQGRSTLRTWVYRILVNTAKKRGVREQRTVPWTSLQPCGEDLEPSVDPAAFRGSNDPYPGHWEPGRGPTPWHSATSAVSTESSVLTHEVRAELRTALSTLPDRQRIVVTLRDVLGHTSDEVCEMLEVSAANQRVLLHRGRARLRELLDGYLASTPVEGGAQHG